MSDYPTTGLRIANVDDLSWLAGNRFGEKEGTCIEEHWSKPAGKAMMCMFRWIQKDRGRFSEFVAIEQEADEVVFRIKHFDPGLVGWETKEDSITFTLVQLAREKAVFIRQTPLILCGWFIDWWMRIP